MIIQSFTASNGPFRSPFAIAPETGDRLQGHITVMIGENGVRKSLALRLLMDAALGKPIHEGHGHPAIPVEITFDGNEPSKVIAVSLTPWDRFPRSWSLSELATSIHGFSNRFVYIGARSREGMISARYNEVTFGRAMLENRWSFERRSEALTPIFERLGLSTAVGIRFGPRWKARRQPGGGISERSMEQLQKVLAVRLGRIQRNPDFSQHWKQTIAEFVREFSTTESGVTSLWRSLEGAASNKITCWITPEGIRFALGFQSIEQWRSALYLGLFEVNGVFFAARGAQLPLVSNQALRESDLSSGQWSWLYNLATLCVELDDHSLVLIDEPENSLHPRWQRDFVSTLSAILKCCEGCHSIVATHSALIASGVRDGLGNVRRLVLREVDGRSKPPVFETVSEATQVDAYGAQVDDVYRELFGLESTRTPEFVTRVDGILAQIRDAHGERPAVAEEDIEYIRAARERLPAHDPMRGILAAIAESVVPEARGK
jgi:hypothetical protein